MNDICIFALNSPIKTGGLVGWGGGGWIPPNFAKVDLLSVDNDIEKIATKIQTSSNSSKTITFFLST